MSEIEAGNADWLLSRAGRLAVAVLALGPAIVCGSSGKEAERDATSSVDVSYEDLIGITDIGGFAVSPDGRFAAVETARADLVSNTTRSRWVIVSLGSDKTVTDVGDGGEPVLLTYHGLRLGYTAVGQTPQWSPDSQWIVYRAMHEGQMQLWRSRRDGAVQEQLTRSAADVQSYRVSRDGKKTYFVVGRDRAEIRRIADQESARGELYDERFNPNHSLVPQRDEQRELQNYHRTLTVELGSREERVASAEEESEETESAKSIVNQHPRAQSVQRSRRTMARAWLEDLRPVTNVGVNPQLTVLLSRSSDGGHATICKAAECSGQFKGVWISDDGETVLFLKWKSVYRHGEIALYKWIPGASSVREVLSTDDVLDSCTLLTSRLICAHESSTTPRKIVAVDVEEGSPKYGTVAIIYDPNRQFEQHRFGEVTPLTWQDARGVEGYGHLVKPVNYVAGRRYPLVIVQYRSRGFLRGGVGDVYPIFVLAAKGFAVLSFDRPEDWKLHQESSTQEEVVRRGWAGLRSRREVLSVLLAGIDVIENMGVADPRRIGITGLSDGGITAAFALIHVPDRFAAAAVNWTAWNPIIYYLEGPGRQPVIRSQGFEDPLNSSPGDQWHEVSIALNANLVRSPLLIQVADSELLSETQTFTELRQHGKAVEMYVFPGEWHGPSQPVHRYNIYKRGVQWFEFWLKGVEEEKPIDPDQYARWGLLRDKRRGG